MTKLPKKIKINHLVYDLKKTKELRNDKGQDLWGLHRAYEQDITLLSGMSPNREIEVLWHEILHSLFDLYDIKSKDEEHLVSVLGHGIASVLIDNPKLLDYFKEVVR